jgi:hypothetical protein
MVRVDLQGEQIEHYDLYLPGEAVFLPELAEILDEL